MLTAPYLAVGVGFSTPLALFNGASSDGVLLLLLWQI